MKLHEDTEAVKQIFDHFRNVGIAAVALGATRFTVKAVETGSTFVQVMMSISTVLLILLRWCCST